MSIKKGVFKAYTFYDDYCSDTYLIDILLEYLSNEKISFDEVKKIDKSTYTLITRAGCPYLITPNTGISMLENELVAERYFINWLVFDEGNEEEVVKNILDNYNISQSSSVVQVVDDDGVGYDFDDFYSWYKKQAHQLCLN